MPITVIVGAYAASGCSAQVHHCTAPPPLLSAIYREPCGCNTPAALCNMMQHVASVAQRHAATDNTVHNIATRALRRAPARSPRAMTGARVAKRACISAMNMSPTAPASSGPLTGLLCARSASMFSMLPHATRLVAACCMCCERAGCRVEVVRHIAEQHQRARLQHGWRCGSECEWSHCDAPKRSGQCAQLSTTH